MQHGMKEICKKVLLAALDLQNQLPQINGNIRPIVGWVGEA
jgi:hypothetical protein